MRRLIIAALAVVSLVVGMGSAEAADTIHTVIIKGYSLNHATIWLKAIDSNDQAAPFQVLDASTRTELGLSSLGDTLVVRTKSPTSNEVTGVDEITHPVGAPTRVFVLVLAFLAVVFAAAVATNWQPQRFLIGVDNRYSNSQCQIVFWFTALATAYATAVVLRTQAFGLSYFGGVGIHQHLAELTGLSALTFGGAKLITVSKLTPPPATDSASLLSAQMIKPPAARPNFLRDLVCTDRGTADFGDFQMILVTVAAVVVFIGQMFSFLGQLKLTPTVTMPDVDTTLLASFGIGQGAYLIKKAASSPGQG